ncbi:DNA double-strand break repair Rad50 ATPase, putative [Entamoeba invadens IP1]|uniref:DNA double-strand break repair Rad50 ATPase, putative n=1 Tax=Entamoeba invadens IP1 TaxID=370355 RepID=A0A0A1UD36_ENTIV|nr:DNA double-strand break repair Rad50 ATPase, putative [Entamoeba invadens IP1]ELP94347.1 DNA double-strand break repair Rad50 ATPase, putative [Entamoeba invadens IP1]|eukprot:XP_004261118.1 DNA double-strand break repair Rad50 ATPase, putative [Entamoeba invadens IP1]
MATEISAQDLIIENLNKTIQNEKNKNSTGIHVETRNDNVTLLQMELANAQEIRDLFKTSKKELKNARKEDLAGTTNMTVQEFVRQGTRDLKNVQQIGDFSGRFAQQKRMKKIKEVLFEEIGFMKAAFSQGKKDEKVNKKYFERENDVKRIFKKYVKKSIDMRNELIEKIEDMREEYIMKDVNDTERAVVDQFVKDLEAKSKQVKIEIDKINEIQREEMEAMEREDEIEKRKVLVNFLDFREQDEKLAKKIEEKQEELEKTEKLLGQRDVYVEKRYKVVRTKRDLRRKLKKLRMRKAQIEKFRNEAERVYVTEKEENLKKIEEKIRKSYLKIEKLTKKEDLRKSRIEILKKDIEYDTTLRSQKLLEELKQEKKKLTAERFKTVEFIKQKEEEKRVALLEIGVKSRKELEKISIRDLTVVTVEIEKAAERAVYARNRIEALKYSNPTPCVVKEMTNYMEMLKRAQKMSERLTARRNELTVKHRKFAEEETSYLIELRKTLTDQLRKAEAERDRIMKETLKGENEKDGNRLDGIEKSIEVLDSALEKVKRRFVKIQKLFGLLKETRGSVYCKKTWKCQVCSHVGQLAQMGLVKRRGDNWAMKKANGFCKTFKGEKREMCYKIAFEVFAAVAHKNDPMKFDVEGVCKALQNC